VDYSKPAAGQLRLFARSVSRLNKPIEPKDEDKEGKLPWLVYLQGGPGFGCGPPQSYPWLDVMLSKGYQVCDAFKLSTLALLVSSVILTLNCH
jgi:proline iminopeptidase